MSHREQKAVLCDGVAALVADSDAKAAIVAALVVSGPEPSAQRANELTAAAYAEAYGVPDRPR